MSAGIEFKGYVINQLGSPALYSDIFINRPPAGFTGRIFVSTDTREIWRDTGTTWELIGSGTFSSVNIYNSNGTLNSNRTVLLDNKFLYFQDNKNGGTSIRVVNTVSGGTADASYIVQSNAGLASFGKRSSVNTGYKILTASVGYSYSDTSFSILADSGNILFAAGGASNAQMTLNNLGRFLLGTTTDAGFLADINGTSMHRGIANFNEWIYINTNNRGIQTGSNAVSVNIRGGRDVNEAFIWSTLSVVNAANSNKKFHDYNLLNIGFNSGTNTYTVNNINPVINNIGGTTTFYGIRYNPTLTNLIGTNHIAIQTDAGKNNFLETNNSQTSGLANYSTYSRLIQNLPAGGSISGGSFYTGAALLAVNNFEGNYTYGSASLNAGGYSGSTINFTAGGTLTVNQAGLRTAAGHLIFNQFGGTATGTISHFAGLQVLGLYNQATGVITPAITNAYGIVINDLNDYSHTFTFTNRWGLYQTGVLDNNYLASKLLVGTNTITARQVHIAGDIELTTTLSATAGGTSGQHLNIWVNGTQYKIQLLNP